MYYFQGETPWDPPSPAAASILRNCKLIKLIIYSFQRRPPQPLPLLVHSYLINTEYYIILYITYYNNWPLLTLKSSSLSHDIFDSLCLKCSKSNGFSNITPPAILTRNTAKLFEFVSCTSALVKYSRSA